MCPCLLEVPWLRNPIFAAYCERCFSPLLPHSSVTNSLNNAWFNRGWKSLILQDISRNKIFDNSVQTNFYTTALLLPSPPSFTVQQFLSKFSGMPKSSMYLSSQWWSSTQPTLSINKYQVDYSLHNAASSQFFYIIECRTPKLFLPNYLERSELFSSPSPHIQPYCFQSFLHTNTHFDFEPSPITLVLEIIPLWLPEITPSL